MYRREEDLVWIVILTARLVLSQAEPRDCKSPYSLPSVSRIHATNNVAALAAREIVKVMRVLRFYSPSTPLRNVATERRWQTKSWWILERTMIPLHLRRTSFRILTQLRTHRHHTSLASSGMHRQRYNRIRSRLTQDFMNSHPIQSLTDHRAR